ncbi:MAG: GntR family transcriptional regulator [Paracoccus sp. (in: a-proteobacteria)]|uniref:GntR family transcriptional regulator n=1 Tax=Paracoccus sp. TaxID=267 RepID=UPI0026DFA08C|nr:GntR family transcriptional regulator [Paracoccus sp. (in: a-proteobacteria)]MDO5614083.1 GntR family transcriptional regulator [Paracoccus sp. (in: a-proteobacteria)]
MTDDPNSPQGQSAYRRLLTEIRSGQLAPGARLRETELADRFGISRTPVREAIRQLEADGLVIHQARQGATIRTLDHAEVIELYEMRIVLEGTAARMAARMVLPVELDELRDINATMAQAAPGFEAQELNRQFHRAVLGAARNRFLVKAVSALQKTMLILGPTTLAEPARPETAASEHAAVIDALDLRDGAAAEQAMRAHLESALNARLRAMRSLEIPLEDE